MMKVRTKAGYAAISVCSVCFSKTLLAFYALKDHSSEIITSDAVFSCCHTEAVTQNRLALARFECATRNDNRSWEDVGKTICNYKDSLQPGWISQLTNGVSEKGQVNVYISDEYNMLLFAVTVSCTGTTQYWCFVCCKSGCHHAGEITHPLIGNPDNAIPQTLRKIRLPAAALTNMKSKKRYPCKEVY
jgi:hypothetical protein